ncbi:MAG: hypothetical protein MI757_17540, partial [Pirellulales bacterium]|nr:hypothetical protein [Pirellulales bacterium]
MTQRKTFVRKIAYLVAIAVLLAILPVLSRPATRNAEGDLSPGGTLSQLRDEYKISQANLGEIDPTSVAARLSTLGMSGIAANISWQRAHHYKKVENWTEYEKTLDEISKLQPNFISVWKFQAWNLAYNVSAELDDFTSRYRWVKKGIRFLVKGTRYNDLDPRLAWEVGWFLNQKIGRSDEKQQYRRLFKRDMRSPERGGDKELRGDMPFSLDDCEDPRGEVDNWLVGQKWYERSQRLVDEHNIAMRMSSPVFHSSVPMAAIKYAAVLTKDGIFDRDSEPIRKAWQNAAEQWNEFGNRSLKSVANLRVRLNDKEYLAQRSADLGKRIAELEAKGDAADQALLRSLQFEKKEADDTAIVVDRYREIVNFDYWQKRCEYEQMPEALAAHRLAYEARDAQRRAEFVRSLDAYHECFKNWRVVLDRYPSIVKQM